MSPRLHNSKPFGRLPALASLGELAKVQPVVVVDSREQRPLVFTRLRSMAGTLNAGDYSIAGCEPLFSVERKTVGDLVGCCVGEARERFERELHRLRGYAFRRLLVIGKPEDIDCHAYHSKIAPRAVQASLRAFEVRYDLPVVWAATPEQGAAMIEDYAFWFSREVVVRANGLLRGAGSVEFASA